MNEFHETLDVLDSGGKKTGLIKLREEIHREGDWHKTVHLWIVTEHNDIFLQKRADGFWLGNGYFDATSVGHIQAGQTSMEAVLRESFEELGLELQEDQLVYLLTSSISGVGSTKKIQKYINNEFQDVFVLRSNINLYDFKFDTGEMKGLELVTKDEFAKMVAERDERLVPQWKEYETLLWYLGGK